MSMSPSGFEFSELEVEQCSSGEFGGGESLVVGCRGFKFGDEFVGNHFAGFVVVGVCAQQFGFSSPVLVNLGGKFHKVAVDVGAGLALGRGAG